MFIVHISLIQYLEKNRQKQDNATLSIYRAYIKKIKLGYII